MGTPLHNPLYENRSTRRTGWGAPNNAIRYLETCFEIAGELRFPECMSLGR
jgi:hypothetical protein